MREKFFLNPCLALLDAGKVTELQKALTNETYRMELLEKYQLISAN